MIVIIWISCLIAWFILGAISAGVFIGNQPKGYKLGDQDFVSIGIIIFFGAISFFIFLVYIVVVLSNRLTRKIKNV